MTEAEELLTAMAELTQAKEDAAKATAALHDAAVRHHLAISRIQTLHERLLGEAVGSRYDARRIVSALTRGARDRLMATASDGSGGTSGWLCG